MSRKELPKNYSPNESEDAIYKRWEESGLFNPDNLKGEPYSIMMPPPNVTGVLHLGHALENTLMDTMIRYQRMNGKKALLLPGTDHAAVATQARVEKELVKQGIKDPRHELGREELLKRIREFAEDHKATMLNQIRKMGTSCDWSRLAYTFDEPRSQAVNEAFKKMYDDGLIFRGFRVINWSVKGQSTCSDDEVVHVERPAKLYTFKYSKDFPIPIATTRPETKLGDTAVAVHPLGKYKDFIDKTFEVKGFGGAVDLKLKIIGSEKVEEEFGTGALGVTPAHSSVDFEMYEREKAKRSPIDLIPVIGNDGKMTSQAGENYAGLSTEEARARVVDWLKANDLLEKEEDIMQNVGTSDRFGDVVEALPMTQWFIDVNKIIPDRGKSLKDLMRDAVTIGHNGDKEQRVKITPDRFEKVYLNWIENLHDWCISRQIWWGHRIPVYYRKQEISNNQFPISNDGVASRQDIFVGEAPPKDGEWEQDPDTLDTWFSSALWTFSTLDYPEKTKDLETFHPTSWMQMGYELVFFWMARMILMSTYILDQIPFKDVYIHGILRDEEGKKFSKSAGNGIDPIDVGKQYGIDALRLSLITGVTPGNDMRFYYEKVEGARNFVNKLWNISRYILTSVSEVKLVESKPEAKTDWDRWILQRLDEVAIGASENIEKYNFSQASEMLREFTWTDFADWYLEVAKVEKGKDEILLYVLQTLLKLWHPYMPFVTEKIWGETSSDLLMIQKWPQVQMREKFDADKIEWTKELVNSIRNLRSEAKIPPAEKLKVDFIVSVDKKALVESQLEIIKSLARLAEVIFVDSISDTGLVGQIADLKFALHYEAKVDPKVKDKEQEELKKYIATLEAKLNDPAFTEKAPQAIIEKERQKLEEAKKKLIG